MDQITVPSSLIAPAAETRLTPAMTSILWQVAAVMDEKRIKPGDDACWVTVPTKRLRGPTGRDDNHWLAQCLHKISHIQIFGEVSGQRWGAVLIAEWRFEQNGSVVRLLIPPAAIKALRSGETFAKIEVEAAYRLSGHARRLYALLADRKRQNRPSWTYDLDELRGLLGVSNLASYNVWQAFKRWILAPALEQINAFGTVDVKMFPIKEGRTVRAVRFDWSWKTPAEAHQIEEENRRHSTARNRTQKASEAPPMIEKGPLDAPRPSSLNKQQEETRIREEQKAKKAASEAMAMEWWKTLSEEEQEHWMSRFGQPIGSFPRRIQDVALDSFKTKFSTSG